MKSGYKAGDTITISVYRDEQIVDIEITLAEDTSARDEAMKNQQNNNNDLYNDFLR